MEKDPRKCMADLSSNVIERIKCLEIAVFGEAKEIPPIDVSEEEEN